MSVRYYKCEILPPVPIFERGVLVDPGSYRPAIALYKNISLAANIPTDRNGIPIGSHCIVVAETEDWTAVEADARCELIAERAEPGDILIDGEMFRCSIRHRTR